MFTYHIFLDATVKPKAAQGVAQCKVSAYARSCIDAALRRIERADAAVTKLQISPVIVNGFKNGFHQWIQRIFLVVGEAKNYSGNFLKIWIHFNAL